MNVMFTIKRKNRKNKTLICLKKIWETFKKMQSFKYLMHTFLRG